MMLFKCFFSTHLLTLSQGGSCTNEWAWVLVFRPIKGIKVPVIFDKILQHAFNQLTEANRKYMLNTGKSIPVCQRVWDRFHALRLQAWEGSWVSCWLVCLHWCILVFFLVSASTVGGKWLHAWKDSGVSASHDCLQYCRPWLWKGIYSFFKADELIWDRRALRRSLITSLCFACSHLIAVRVKLMLTGWVVLSFS